jgi:hypothetical protein
MVPTGEAGSQQRQGRTPRGFVPPALRLSEAVALAQKVNEMAAGSASYDSFSQITGNTKTSSTFSRKVSALRLYGIIEDRDNIVSLSELGNRIATPRDESDDLLAIKEAMLRVEILNKIYERHRGRILPEDQFLNNVLLQELKVPRDFSKTWVEYFQDAIQTAKLTVTRPDGKTQLVERSVSSNSAVNSALALGAPLTPPDLTPPVVIDFSESLPIPLGKGRIALLKLPAEWNARKDLSRLLKMIQLSLSEDEGEDGEP